jgi:DNA-binding LacI/PurR family transcriptional regulator
LEDVAERAGVSRALVSLVMNDSPKVSDARRSLVLEAATELGYRRNLHARNLAQRRTGTIGVLINDIHNPFFAGVIEGVEHEAERRGLDVLILNGGRDPQRESKAIDTYLQFRVEALVLIGSRLDDEQLLAASTQVPSVIVASGWNHPGIDTVTTDDEAGA